VIYKLQQTVDKVNNVAILYKVWDNKTSSTLPLFIALSVESQESERSCKCVLEVSILPLSTIFRWILELFLFSFYYIYIAYNISLCIIWSVDTD
jgi:hypothetical protein